MLVPCSICGRNVSNTATKCPHCQASLGAEGTTLQCVECKGAVAQNATSCPHCGYVKGTRDTAQSSSSIKPGPVFTLLAVAATAVSLVTPKIFFFFPALAALGSLVAGLARREKGSGIGAAVIGVFFALIVFGLSYHPTYRVTYKVSGSGPASLTYEDEGGTAQEKVVLPWAKTITKKGGDFLYISAQNEDEHGGTIEATIEADDHPLKTSSSSGRFTIASTSTSCCQAD